MNWNMKKDFAGNIMGLFPWLFCFLYIDCGSLENITDGRTAALVTTYEATANYTCNPGYVINGTRDTVLTVTCGADGTWSQATPTCDRRGIL